MLKDIALKLLYSMGWFLFEFIGDRPWLALILVGLVALLVWRFLWPVVIGFHKVFGWKGWALIAVALLTFGAFGAGWRAHRDSTYPDRSDLNDVKAPAEKPPAAKKPKPKPKPLGSLLKPRKKPSK